MQAKIIEILLVIFLLGGGYFYARHQADKIDKLTVALESTKTVLTNYDASVKAENESRTAYLNTLREFRESENINRAAVAVGAKRLYVKATCPKAAETGNSAGTPAAGAVLDTSARQDYFNLRDNIAVNETKLTKCIADLKSAYDELSRVGAYVCN